MHPDLIFVRHCAGKPREGEGARVHDGRVDKASAPSWEISIHMR